MSYVSLKVLETSLDVPDGWEEHSRIKESYAVELVGGRAGRWSIFQPVRKISGKKSTHFMCKCECGGVKPISITSLRNGSSSSCGCLSHEMTSKRSSKPRGYASAISTYHLYKTSAKKRGLSFLLSRDKLIEICESNCFYCGTEPKQIVNLRGANGSWTRNGIDRVDNKLGYTDDNVVSCCKSCNRAKSSLSLGDFKNLVVNIFNHLDLRGDDGETE